MRIDINKIGTEQRNEKTIKIDMLSTLDMVKLINEEDKTVALAVEKATGQIAQLVDKIVLSFNANGRLIYLGAGTSGRIGTIDAVECRPTFSVSDDMVQCVMAGGASSMTKAVEGAEDSKELAVQDLKAINLNANDVVVGIAASGRTPYVIGGIEYANLIGCTTGCITTSPNSELASIAGNPIEAITGAEPITGSTRMKSGTAQKMICNMLSTAAMIKMGKVYENLMVDVQATNQKLIKRAHNIISQATGVSMDDAQTYIDKYGTVKKSIFAILSGIEDVKLVDNYMNENKGNIRKALKEVHK